MTNSPKADPRVPTSDRGLRWSGTRRRVCAAICLGLAAWPIQHFGGQPAGSLQGFITTNYVVVTNVVIITNLPATSTVTEGTPPPARGPVGSGLPDLGWLPPEDQFDWIQLNTGEWLKGHLKAMQDRELEFDSEKLNDLSFDWKDVRQVRSPRLLDVLFVDGTRASGPITATPSHITVGGPEPVVVGREQLQSITPGGSKERNYWSGSLALGLTARSGNRRQIEYNAQTHLQRRTPATRLSLDYIGNISSVEGVQSANNHRVNSEFDLWLSRRFYLIVPFAEYYRDPFQNLDHRLTIGAGIGYDLIDRPKLEWNITTGPGFQQAWFDSNLPGEATEKGTAALAFGSRFDWDITRRIDLILEYRGQYTSREVGETTHHAVTTLSLELTTRFDLDVSLIWDRISNPKVGSDGQQPQPDDFRMVVGLGVDF